METTEVIIARLVLGYLKEEKCRKAYKEFLASSHHLQSDAGTKSRYLPTRFVGLTLTDILCEYFALSKIVQGRLEATNYYNECHSRVSLVQQLLYLLNKSLSSRTSTPCPRSPLESNLGETSPSHIDHVSDIETTPIHTLPGNLRCTSEDSFLYRTHRKKANSKLNKSATVANIQVAEKEDMSEVLANTLLENKEFHEKIAQTINKVAEKRYRVSSELDRTVKTVVRETEADPIFDKILEEIIGSTSVIENRVDTSSTTSSINKVQDDSRNKSKRTQHCLSSEHSEEDLDQIHHNPQTTVEQQNDEAIRSIIANSNVKVPSQGNSQEVHMNNEVTVFNGSLDKYLTSNTCHANTQTQPVQNPLYINTTGLLMVNSGITSNGNLQIDSTKQYYLVNKQPPVNWNIPPIQTTNIITEQDILAMPTVIVSDEGQNKVNTPQPALQTSVLSTKSKLPVIVPKPTIEIAPEYLSAYNGNEIPQQTGLKNVVYPKTTKKSKTKEKTATTTSCQTTTEDAPCAQKSLPDNLNQQDEESETTTTVQPSVNTNSEHSTPLPVTERIQKTPKSGSHVRNLDFSTPPKITSTHKKSLRNKVNNSNTGNKSPQFVHKKQAAKTLFNQQACGVTDDKTPQRVRDPKPWDSDLRASVLLPEDEKCKSNPLKRKKKTPIKKVKKKMQKITKTVKRKLNTTEQDAAVIEAALQTPIKHECEKSTNSASVNNDSKRENKDNTIKGENDSNNVINSDVNAQKINETEAKESNECNTNKTILSPSKLNANKRKLISSDIVDNNAASDLIKPIEEATKFITPEMVKENFHYPIKANRNITSMFDTPLKDECIPKTPGSPTASLNTPFTKMLEANLKGIDISSLPTPSIPITPNFPPFTPNVEISPYSNRPTDYSTSSSYYQPSDSEPNRSLEANVIELEKRPVGAYNDAIATEGEAENKEVKTDPIKPINNILDERLKIFNGSIIGKKNLNLVKRNVPSNSSSSDSSSESSNEDNASSCSWVDKSDETIIFNKKTLDTPRRTYSLRNRNTINKKEVTKVPEVKESNVKQANKNKGNSKSNQKHEEIQNSLKNEKPIIDTQIKLEDNEVNTKVEEERKKLMENENFQLALRKELSEKLSRTKNKIKAIEKPTRKNSKSIKNTKSKFMKIKLFPKNKKKEKESPKKIEKSNINIKDDLCDDSINRVSNENKSDNRVKKNKSIPTTEKIDKSASDIEAQNLIEGLKERGIHLVKNKSPNKKSNGSPNFSELEKDINNENGTLKDAVVNTSMEENPHERSTSELETEWRDTYDTATFEEHECVIFSESKKIAKSFESYNTKVLEKTFIGKVFIEEINKELEIPLVVSPFYSLLDLPPSRSQSQKQKAPNQRIKLSDKKMEEKTFNKDSIVKTEADKNATCSPQNPLSGNDHHTNHTNIASLRDDKEVLEPPSLKKRKIEKEDCRVPEEKECKILLQQINVDTFLNNIYGNS